MLKGMNLDYRFVGAMLANEDAKDQAEFFKGLIKECRSWGTKFQIETQFASVNELLTDEEREALAMLSYKEE